MSVVSTFPRRPLQLSSLPSKRIGWLPVLAYLLFGFGLVADCLYVVPPLIDDALLGASAKLARQAAVTPGGKCTVSRGVLTDCHFEVVFQPEGGQQIQKPLRYFALFQTIDDQVPFRLYYDPANPQRVSTSWGQDLLINRLASQVVALAIMVGSLVYFPLAYRRNLQLRRSLLAMATAPRPVVARFIRMKASRAFAMLHFTWTDPETGASHRDSSRLSATADPFWLDQEHKTLLALAGPDGRAHALDQWLRPAVLTDEERQALAQAPPTTAPSMANQMQAAAS